MGNDVYIYLGNVKDLPGLINVMRGGGGAFNGATVPAAAGIVQIFKADGYGWAILYN